MKLTKSHLRDMIKEELIKLNEARLRGDPGFHDVPERGGERLPGPSRDADQMKVSQQRASEKELAMGQKGGIDDKERAVLVNLQQTLHQAARKGNILTGTIMRRLEMLRADLEKALAKE